MAAHSPEQIDSLFAQALNAGNLDALVALYEPQASLMASPGTLVAGTAAIRESLSAFVALKPTMQIAPRLVSRSGDLAVVTAKWQLAMTGSDGKPSQMQGQSVEVVRRQADGRWLFVIDLPFGAEAGAKP
jgi:uncharacterized protein (TIGR02246 family)